MFYFRVQNKNGFLSGAAIYYINLKIFTKKKMPHKGHHDDDHFHAMEGDAKGHSHGHSHDHHHETPEEKEKRVYEASKKKLYTVSIVTVFFIIA